MERNDLLLPYRELAGLRDRFQAGGDKITLGSYLAGEQYGAERAPRILVVGRALNGWLDTFCDRDAKTTLALWETQEKTGVPMPYRTVWDAAAKAYVPAPVSRCRGLGWVDTYLASGNGDRKRKTADTPFWRAARAAAERLLSLSPDEGDAFYRHIAWTNLFKACPARGGNPQGELWLRQIGVCREILKREAEILMPTHILVIAQANTNDTTRENEWIAPFEPTLRTLAAQGIRVVSMHRPEFRRWTEVEKELDTLLTPVQAGT